MIHENSTDHLATLVCRQLLKAKLDLLQSTIDQVFPIDDISTIVPQAYRDVNDEIVEDTELTRKDANTILMQVEKHIATLSDIYADHLANPVTQVTQPIVSKESIMSNTANTSASNSEATTTPFVETVSINQPSTTESDTMNTNTSSTAAASNEQAQDKATIELNETAAAAKSASRRRGFKTAGEVTSTVGIIGGAIYGASKARPIIVSKILEVTGWGAPAAVVTEVAAPVVAETAEAVLAAEGAAGFLGGTIELGGYAVPEVALAAAAAIAVAAVGYAGYKYYQGRQVKKAAALAAEKPMTAAEAEAKIEAAVDAVEDSNLKSFLKGLLAGAKSSFGALKTLILVNIAFILAAVATGAGFPVIASLVYAAVGLYFIWSIAVAVIAVMTAAFAGFAIAGMFAAADKSAKAAA